MTPYLEFTELPSVNLAPAGHYLADTGFHRGRFWKHVPRIDAAALLREAARGGATDARGGAGHDEELVLESGFDYVALLKAFPPMINFALE
jgi:hypothetical protein